jgi:CRP-like cAMP-binding protein
MSAGPGTTIGKPVRGDGSLFSDLPAPLFAGLFAAAHPVRLTADQMLFLAGDAGDGCYLIEEGLLKVTAVSPAGGERILAILGPGAVVGELSMIDGAPRSNSVCAVRDCALRFIGRGDFQAFSQQHPEIYRHIVSVLAKRLRDTNLTVAAASFLTLKGRVARALITLAEAFGHEVDGGRIVIRQKVSQSDLAAMTGIARENVSRILSEWMRLKVVSRIASYYCLERRGALDREAEL